MHLSCRCVYLTTPKRTHLHHQHHHHHRHHNKHHCYPRWQLPTSVTIPWETCCANMFYVYNKQIHQPQGCVGERTEARPGQLNWKTHFGEELNTIPRRRLRRVHQQRNDGKRRRRSRTTQNKAQTTTMFLFDSKANPNATSCSIPSSFSSTIRTILTTSPVAKSNTINSKELTSKWTVNQSRQTHSGSSAVFFCLSRQKLLAFSSMATFFVLLNFTNWPSAHCVDSVVTRQHDTLDAQHLLLQLDSDQSNVDGQFHKNEGLKIIDYTPRPLLNNILPPPNEGRPQKPTCLSKTPTQSQQVVRWWKALPAKRTFRKRFASSESIMKREVYPLPRSETPPISSSLHRPSFLGPRNVLAGSGDGRTHNDTTIIQANIFDTGKPETSSLSPNHPPLSITHHPPTASSSTVDRFKTSFAFEAAAKQRYHNQETKSHYGGHPNESDTYPGHIQIRRPIIDGSTVKLNNTVGKGKGEDNQANDDDDEIVVTLLGLFELSTKNDSVRSEGHSELAAARLAVRHINKLRLLPGYRLELVTNDTKVSWAGCDGVVRRSSEFEKEI